MPVRVEYDGYDITAGTSELTINDEDLVEYKRRFDTGYGASGVATYTWSRDPYRYSDKISSSTKKDKIPMKEKILVTLVIILALGGAGYAAVHHHNQNVYHQEQAEALAEQQAVARHNAEVAAQKAAQAKAAQQAAAEAAAAKAAAEKPVVKSTTVVK